MTMPGPRHQAVALLAAATLVAAGCGTSAPPSPTPGGSVASSPTAAPSPSAAESASPSPSRAPAGWRELTATGAGPAPREDHTWTTDGNGQTAYLFGGRDQAGYGAFADLWAYDLATDSWEPRAAGPPARFGHNAAWVPGVGLVVFAGQAETTFYNDLWAYDPVADSWRKLPAGGAVPVPRYGSCAALGPDGRLWISHGFTAEGSRFSDTRAYDFGAGTWTDETPLGDVPIVRCLHACWWTGDGRLALYGGQTTGTNSLGDLWALTVGQRPGTNAWAQAATPPLAARNLYAAGRWGDATLVFGGQDLGGGYLGDTWLLNDDGTQTQVLREQIGPPQRSGAELVADPPRGRALLFGGKIGAAPYGDLWELTLP